MAGTIIDMSRIKQILQLRRDGVSNRRIARELGISRDKTNEYIRMAETDSLGIDGLLRLDDPVLERRFHPGNPAYSDERMDTFLRLLPDFVEQLSHRHVTRQPSGIKHAGLHEALRIILQGQGTLRVRTVAGAV